MNNIEKLRMLKEKQSKLVQRLYRVLPNGNKVYIEANWVGDLIRIESSHPFSDNPNFIRLEEWEAFKKAVDDIIYRNYMDIDVLDI